MASASAFQAEDDGSIPFTRSNPNERYIFSKMYLNLIMFIRILTANLFKHQSFKLKPLNKVFCSNEGFWVNK